MSRRAKPVVIFESADRDVLQALDGYLEESSEVAARFIRVLERAFRNIQQSPAAGSQKYAHALDIPGLRFWVCARYPYLVFYVEHPDRIAVWRVLHASRDIPASLELP